MTYKNRLICLLMITMLAGLGGLGCENDTTSSGSRNNLAVKLHVENAEEYVQLVDRYLLTVQGAAFDTTVLMRYIGGFLTAEVDVPAGENLFIAQAVDEASRPVYSGRTSATVVQDQITEIEITLLPVARLVNLSPRYQAFESGQPVSFDVKAHRIEDLNQISFRLNFQGLLPRMDSVRLAFPPSREILLFDTVLSSNQWAVAISNTSQLEPLVDISGNADLATVYLTVLTPLIFPLPLDTMVTSFSALTMYDTANQPISAGTVITDEAMVVFGTDTTSEPPPVGELVPLQVGNYWVYNVYDSLGEPVGQQTLGITGSQMITHSGTTYEVLHWNWYEDLNTPSSSYILVRNGEEGLWAMGYYDSFNDTLVVDPQLAAKYPAAIGDSWSYVDVEFGETYIYECVSTDQTISTPAGSFSCYVYSESFPAVSVQPDGNPHSLLYPVQPKAQRYPQRAQFEVIYVYFSPEVGYVGAGLTVTGSPIQEGLRLSEYFVQ